MIHEEYEEAIQCCYKAKKCDPNNTNYLLMLTLIKHNMGWDAEAIHVLDEMKQRDPNNPSIYHLFGIIFKDRCLYKDSIEFFMKGLELAPYQIISIENIVDIYWETGNYELAQNVITKALELFSDSHYLASLEYKKTLVDSVLSQDGQFNLNSSIFEKFMASNKLQSGFSFRSVALEKSALNNVSLLKYYNGDIEGALSYLLTSFNIDPIIFTQDVYNNYTIQSIYSQYPQTIRLLWFYLTKLGCSKTSLVLMQLLYDRHVMIGKKPGGKDCSTFFWYYISLASAGSPWKLLDYSKWIFDEVTKRDDSTFYMQVYAYNRMVKNESDLKKNAKLRSYIETNLLVEATRSGSLTPVEFEKALYYYNIEDYNNSSACIPKVSNISELSPEFQLLQAKILYKKKSTISSRQALQILSNLQRSGPKNYEYVYLRLKIFFILDDSNFASVYRDFNPITIEFQLKKLKLGTKYYINHFDIEKSRTELEKLEKIVENIPDWLKTNKIEQAQIFNLENYKSSIHFLKANVSYISNESYFSTLNPIHSISADYMKKPKAIIFELKFSLRSPSSQYYQTQFYEKAQQSLKEIDPKFQNTCWQWIIIYLLSNNMKKQALIVSNNMGSTRFARIDTLYPLCKIAFLTGLNDNLESYLSKLDLSIIKMQAKSIETRQLLSEFDLFKLRVTLNKFNRSNANIEISSLIDEFKMGFNNLWPYLNYLKGLYKENICEILISYLSFTNSNDSFIQKISNEAPDLIPYSFAKNVLDRSIREDEKKKNFELFLKSYSESVNTDQKINYQLVETLKKGDVSFLNSREMNTVSDLSNFARQINTSAYENIITKMISENKFLTIEKIKIIDLVLKEKLSNICLQWVQYEISKRDQKTPFFDTLNGMKPETNNRNLFSYIEILPSNTKELFDYVKTVESIASKYQEPIIESHLILAHIMKLSITGSSSNELDSSKWYLNHNNLLDLARDFIERNTEPLVEKLEETQENNLQKQEALEIQISEEFDTNYIHGKKNSLFWKCIFYIFNDSSNDDTIWERMQTICEQTSNIEDLSINLNFILHEWSIKEETLKFRLNKIQTKTGGDFMNLFISMLSDCFALLEKDSTKVFNFVKKQLLIQSKTTIRKSKKIDWKEFVEFINNNMDDLTKKDDNIFGLRKISQDGIIDWRIGYALLSTKLEMTESMRFCLTTMTLESIVILFSSLISTNKYSDKSFGIEEIFSQACSNMFPSSFGCFTYQPTFEEQKPSVFYSAQLLIIDFLDMVSKLVDCQPSKLTDLKHCINILSYLLEYRFITKDLLDSVSFCTKWAKIFSFIIDTFNGEEQHRLIGLFLFKNSYKSIQKFSSLENINFVLEFLRFCNIDTFRKFMEDCEDYKFKSIETSLIMINDVLYNNLESSVTKDEFLNSLMELFKHIGKSATKDNEFKWMQFVNSVDIAKFSHGNNNNLWEMRFQIDKDFEQEGSNENLTITLSPIPNKDNSNLEVLTSNAIRNFIGIERLETVPIMNIGGVYFKIIRKQSNSLFVDLQGLKSVNFSMKKPENVLSQYFTQHASQRYSTMSYDVETKKKNTVLVTKYHIYKNSWYEMCERIVKDLAKWSAISWFIGLGNVQDDSIIFNMEKGKVLFDNLACTFLHATMKEYCSPFRLDLDFQNLLQKLNLLSLFESEFEKSLNMLLTPFNIQVVNNLARKLIRTCSYLNNPKISNKKVFLFEDNSLRAKPLNTNETLKADRYLFELLKRNFKLERQLTKSRLASEGRPSSSSLMSIKPREEEKENEIATPLLPLNDSVIDLFNKRLNGWVLLANSLKQDKSDSINFETCGLKCNNVIQLSTELLTQAKLFSK